RRQSRPGPPARARLPLSRVGWRAALLAARAFARAELRDGRDLRPNHDGVQTPPPVQMSAGQQSESVSHVAPDSLQQEPFMQASAAGQTAPHAPQFEVSVEAKTQR